MLKKHYAVVYQNRALLGVFDYHHVSLASYHQANFSQALVQSWMTSLDLLDKVPGAAFDKLLQRFALTAPLVDYQPITNETGHWLGFIAPDGVLMPSLPATDQQGCLSCEPPPLVNTADHKPPGTFTRPGSKRGPGGNLDLEFATGNHQYF